MSFFYQIIRIIYGSKKASEIVKQINANFVEINLDPLSVGRNIYPYTLLQTSLSLL